MQFDKELDARGLSCPLPILKTKKALNDLTSGQVLKVVSTEPRIGERHAGVRQPDRQPPARVQRREQGLRLLREKEVEKERNNRLPRAQPGATTRDSMQPKKMAIIATKGTLDIAYPPLILASTAAAMGFEVADFLHVLRPAAAAQVASSTSRSARSPIPRCRCRCRCRYVVVVAAGDAEHGDENDEAEAEEKGRRIAGRDCATFAIEAGVKFIACQMTVDLFEFKTAATSSTASNTAARRRSSSSPGIPTSACSSGSSAPSRGCSTAFGARPRRRGTSNRWHLGSCK